MNCRRTLDDSPTGTLGSGWERGEGGREGEGEGGLGERSRELREEWGAKWGSGRES